MPRADWITPHPDRLPLDHPLRAEILSRHAVALQEGRAGYDDPETGLFVLTAAFHMKRASCCHNGCRHCPYLGGA